MIICIDALTLILFLHYLLYLQVEVTRVSVIAVLLIAAAANMVIVVVIAKARNSCEPVLVQFHPVCYMYVYIYLQCYIELAPVCPVIAAAGVFLFS